jgi:hypothetical protein
MELPWWIAALCSLSVNLLIIVGPVLAYLKQYALIRDTKKMGSFSYDVCGILLFGQALRIIFW